MPDFGKYNKRKVLIEKFSKISFAFFLISTFANFWIWFLFSKKSYVEFFIVVVSSFLLIFTGNFHRKFLIFLFPLLFIFFQKPFPQTIAKFSSEEIFFINQRRSSYENQFLGRLFENKATLLAYKYKRNIFTLLDLNYYFFAAHPRERAGIVEVNKFTWIFLPFFLVGLFSQVKRKYFWGMIYFLFIVGLISIFSDIESFSFLTLPFFTLLIYRGFEKVFVKSKSD